MSYNHHHQLIHLPHWTADLKLPGLTGLYINATVRNLGISLVSIFIPLFILKTTGSIFPVFVFYFCHHLTFFLLNYPLALIITKIGPDIASLLSCFLLGLYLYTLSLIKLHPKFLLLAAVLGAVYLPLYWLPYHLAFMKLGKESKYGETLSWFSILGRITTALGPVAGGFIIVLFGFDKLFSSAVVVIFISTIPLFFDRFTKTPVAPGFKHIVKGLFSSSYRGDFFAFSGAALETFVVGVLWPIFIYKMVLSYKVVGAISSFSLLLSMLVLFWVGKQVDKRGQGQGILRLGVLGNSLNWLVRVFLNTGWQVFLAEFFYNLGAAFIWTPFDAVVYKKAMETDPFDFMIRREMALHFGGGMAVLIVAVLWAFKPSWLSVFVLGMVGLVLTGLMIRKKRIDVN